MRTKSLVLLCAPTVLVTLVFDFVPWGLAASAVTLLAYGALLAIPNKTWARVNATTAVEGLSYGDLRGAKDHIEIALREAESDASLTPNDVDLLRDACEKVAAALIDSGQNDVGKSLRERGEALVRKNT